MNVYMRRTARLYEFKRTSRVPNGPIFFCSFPPSSAETDVLTAVALSHREAAVETDGSLLPVQTASREAHLYGPKGAESTAGPEFPKGSRCFPCQCRAYV